MLARPLRSRILPLAAIVLFLSSAWTPALAQGPIGQQNLLTDLEIPKGGVQIFYNGKPVNFLKDNETATLEVRVTNRGSTNATNIPLYVWAGIESGANYRRCAILPDVPPGGDYYQTFLIKPDHTWKNVGHIINATVNADPETNWGATFSSSERCSTGAKAENAEDDGASSVDNIGWGYFVKNETVDLELSARPAATTGEPDHPKVEWCRRFNTEAACHDMELGDDAYFNVTSYGNAERTFFQITVRNNGTWQDMTNFSSASCRSTGSTGGNRFLPRNCADFAYTLNVTVAGPGINSTNDWINVGATPILKEGNISVWTAGDWRLRDRAGNYTVTARIDPTNSTIRQNWTAADIHSVIAQVRWVDIAAGFKTEQFRTDPTDPYPFQVGTQIAGTATFYNEGLAPLKSGRTTTFRAYIDSPESNFSTFATLPSSQNPGELNPADWFNLSLAWQLDTRPGDQFYLAPGRHVLVAEADSDEQYLELNETNNRFEIPIYIEDTGKPIFPTYVTNPLVRLVSNLDDPRTSGPSDATLRPRENFTVHARVNDSDPTLTVVANFSLKSDANTTREYNMSRATPGSTEDGNRFFVTISDFAYGDPSNQTDEKWNLRIQARDPTGNVANSTTLELTLRPWDIQTAPLEYFVLVRPADDPEYGIANNGSINWTDVEDPSIYLKILKNVTGFDQHNFTGNFWADVDFPGDDIPTRRYNGSEWFHPDGPRDRCLAPSKNDDTNFIDPDDPTRSNPTEEPCPDYGEWILAPSKHDGKPGQWNFTVGIADRSWVNRTFNWTIHVVDQVPEVRAFQLSKDRINATEHVNLTSEILEDFSTAAVHANFTRSDGLNRNVTITRTNQSNLGENELSWWNATIQTGRGTQLDVAGNFTVRLEAKDENGNWGHSLVNRTILIVDDAAPSITSAGTNPATQEVGGNVTFYATVTDQTNVTVRLSLFRAGEEIRNATLEPGEGNNYTLTLPFDEEVTYNWEIQAFDGNANGGLPSLPARGILRVVDNIGPRYDILAPSFTSNGERYGRASQRVQVLVYDSDGVERSSINLTVDGVEIPATDLTFGAPPAGYLGHTVSYAIPASAGYGHNDTVTIALAATDLSNKTLSSEVAFTYRVDDQAPVSRLVSLEPRFRALESDPWNISLESRFTLSAVDNDGMPTDVETIRYVIIGGTGGSDREAVYAEPFTIRSIDGAYTGPRPYLVEYWAEDAVGNRESPHQRIPVYVDNTAPVLDPFGSLPQGRFVNATFIDDRSGVERAVVWYSLNGTPYLPVSLEAVGDVWNAVLPEGKKGERMSYYLQAWDHVGNTEKSGNETEPYSAYTVGNHLPQLRLVNPPLGDRVSKNLEVRWTATDEDDDALRFVVYLKAPNRANFVELATIDAGNQRTFLLDTTRYPDGEYTIALTASDGSFVARAESTVIFLNNARPVGNVTAPTDAKPGEGVLITAEVTKANARVEARIYRGSDLVESYAMNDEGRDGDVIPNDGIYSARVTLARAGDYNVAIVTQYQEGGETKEQTVQGPAFTVKLTPGAILSEFALLWVALVTLALAAVGIAGYALYRKWR